MVDTRIPPLILFGAFDRHNLGDLLLARVAERQADRPVLFAGLATRDMRAHGGPACRALPELARAWGEAPVELLHVGGELLTCTLDEAAVMLLPEAAAHALLARPDGHLDGRAYLGLQQHLGYLAAPELFRRSGRFSYRAVGGVALDGLPAAARDEALTRLRQAASVSVRDRVTAAHLARAGIPAGLEADPVTRVARLFGPEIARHAGQGEPAAVRAHFRQGYLACQCSGEFGDDATLTELAAALDGIARDTGLGICLFRAGAAPWHDDLEVYRRLAGRLTRGAWVFQALHVWDICALIAGAGAYCGSSLHGRIVAEAFGVPGVQLSLPGGAVAAKLAAYGATWGGMTQAAPGACRGAMRQALAAAARVYSTAESAWQPPDASPEESPGSPGQGAR